MSHDTRAAGPVVTGEMVAGLRDGLRGLVALGVPAESVEASLGEVLQRLHAGVKQVRPNKQLAPWMHAVLCRVVAPRLSGAAHSHLSAGDAVGQDRIAAALAPFTMTLPEELAEVLRLTDFGALTQRSAATRMDLGKVAFKSKVNSARRRLRIAVEAGLALALDGRAADAQPDAADLDQDVRPPRQRVPASSLIPAFTAGLEQLVRPWVSADQAPTVAASVLGNLCAGRSDQPHNGRLPNWIYAVTRAVVVANATDTSISTAPSHPTAEARSILAPAMHALLADVDADQVTAITLVDLEGHSQRDAARRVGILPETLKQRLWRARRLGWQSLTRALAASRQPAPAPTHFTALLDALQALILHLAPTVTPNPALQRLLRQLHADAPSQRPSSSVVDFFYAATVSSLQPTPHRTLPTPPAERGPAERAALAACLAPFLASLTPEQSEALTLIDLDGLSLNAAAAQVGTDRPTFQGRLQRGRIRLRQLLTGCLSCPSSAHTAA